MVNYREFHNTSRTGAVRVWKIAVGGAQILTKFGQLGGKMQEVIDMGSEKNKGRANEISAEQDALNTMNKLILSKVRKGYVELGEESEESELDLIQLPEFPQNLTFYKPYNSVSGEMGELISAGRAWLIRKYDGEMMIIQKTLEGKCQMYSRRMLRTHHLEPDTYWEERFPHLVEEVEGNEDIPNGTVLLGEMVAGRDLTGAEDNRWEVS